MDEFEISYYPGQEISANDGENVLWRYHFATDRRKPFIHPITTLGGAELTCFEAWDHWWHRGHWFSLQYVNDVNYWEEDIEKMGPKGNIGQVGEEEVFLHPDRAIVRTKYVYLPPEGDSPLEDARELVLGLPDEEGCFTLDWSIAITAKAKVTIKGVTEEWGGYTGLSWRSSRSMGGLKLLNSEGQTGNKNENATQHQPARWVDLTGQVDGGRDIRGGMTFMIHPSTLRFPASWKTFANDGFGFINPSLIMTEPLELKKGESIALKYRVLVHDDELDKDDIEALYKVYSA